MTTRSWWANLPLRAKGLVVVAIPMTAVAVALLSFSVLQRQQQEAEARLKQTSEVRANIQDVRNLAVSADASVRGYLMVGGASSVFAGGEEAVGFFLSEHYLQTPVRQLRTLLADQPAQIERLNRIVALVRQERQILIDAVTPRPDDTVLPGRRLPRRQELKMYESQAMLNSIRREFDAMLVEELRNLADWTDRAARVRDWILYAIAGSAAFALGGGILAVLLFTTGIGQRVHQAEENARRLAVGLPMVSLPQGRDEIGRLGKALEEACAILAQRGEAVETRTRELQEANQRLDEASRHKSEFLANMSHELRTPLNAILGYTELIQDNIYGEVPPKIREIIERVQHSGRHLLGLINDVLDLSKIEAGHLTLSLNDYSVRDIVQSVLTAMEPLAAEKRLALKVSVPSDLPTGRGDERRITQVLMNLVGNAIKFTDAGEIRVHVTASDGQFVVSVADTGPGIAEADQEKIFQEFQQVEGASTRTKGGTGLGLAIARKIVELHRGRMWVESSLGKGSTFWFTVPVRVDRQEEAS